MVVSHPIHFTPSLTANGVNLCYRESVLDIAPPEPCINLKNICNVMKMEDLLERALLRRLEAGFGLENGNEDTTKAGVSAYIAYLAQQVREQQDGDTTIPEKVTGLRRRYLEAVEANARAKIRHNRAPEQNQGASSIPKAKHHTTDLLSARLDHLIEEKQHSELNIIDYYTRKLSDIPKFSRTDPSQTAENRDSPRQTDPEIELDVMIQNAKDSSHSLETTVLQARHSSSREKARLRSVQDLSHSTESAVGTDQVRALGMVRDKLTTWLEDILVKCSTRDNLDVVLEECLEHGRGSTTEDVRVVYDGYVETRKKTLDAVQMSSDSRLVSSATIAATGSKGPMRDGLAEPEDSVISQEHAVRDLEFEKTQRQLLSYLEVVEWEERAETIEILQRLADESQLLPAYPQLAHSERFNEAFKTIGRRDVDLVHDPVIGQVGTWAFAAGAAGQTSDFAVTRHTEQGHEGMEEVQNNMRDLSLLNESSAAA